MKNRPSSFKIAVFNLIFFYLVLSSFNYIADPVFWHNVRRLFNTYVFHYLTWGNIKIAVLAYIVYRFLNFTSRFLKSFVKSFIKAYRESRDKTKKEMEENSFFKAGYTLYDFRNNKDKQDKN